MKTKSLPARLFFATAVLGLLASTAFAGEGGQYWRRTKPVTTFSDVKKISPDDMVMMQCKNCKTAMIHTSRHVGSPAKGHHEWATVGSRHTCDECQGEITVVKGKSEDSMQFDCAKCGAGSVTCCTLMAEKASN